MPRVLLTRPRAQSEAFARDLADDGWSAAIWPVIEIEPALSAPPDWTAAQALLFTSARAVEALSRFPRPALPALCVGPATARAAREAGFARVEDAAGDAAALAALAARTLRPEAGALIHVRGADAAGDLAGALAAKGFATREAVAYRAVPAAPPSAAVSAEMTGGRLDAAAFFSPRSGDAFVALAPACWSESLARMTAVAISAATAATLRTAGFDRIAVAARPDGGAMRAAICGAA